jgi:class 3 adenylate cyclase
MAFPTGTITFLFTDMREALERHDAVMSAAIADHGGYVFATGGDGFAAAFDRVTSAMTAALEGQRALERILWPSQISIRVRMALHTGEAMERGGDYFGPAVNRTARLMAAGHGGQILCSGTATAMSADLPEGSTLRDLGEHRLRDLTTSEHIFELIYPGAPEQGFPPLRRTHGNGHPVRPSRDHQGVCTRANGSW